MSKSRSNDKNKYFTGASGELKELREDLRSTKSDNQKKAVKKVIALMTIGRDVSVLFPDIVKCMQTDNLELKKLVYLYLMNYATTAPDLAILAVSTFQKDAADENPLIRALAIRTMGCIRVDQVVPYLGTPLRSCLEDKDPYVVKTAALCVAKLYDIDPELVENGGFIEMLKDLLGDSNPMVVANAVAALSEIDEVSPEPIFRITKSNLNRLLSAIEACTEWGQVFIMNSLAKYVPKDSRTAEIIADKIAPRLAHANSAVVLASIKVIIHFIGYITNDEKIENLLGKIRAPLVSLLSKNEPEIQYVALRNINLILQKFPGILTSEFESFYCKSNDKLYVKLEKLELLIMLATRKNAENFLRELREYAIKDLDVEFVKKAVRSVGRVAIKLEPVAEKCVHLLLELLETGSNSVIQEAIIVVKDIFRKYSNRFESIIPSLCEHIEYIDDPEAKSSIIWILGEYADRVQNALDLLLLYRDTFREEAPSVQLQILTAFVKLCLKRGKSSKQHVLNLLETASNEIDNPDVRDRTFIYWRLLSSGAQAAKKVVFAEKPEIRDDSNNLDENVLDNLLSHLSTLASVYHKPPETFIQKLKQLNRNIDGQSDDGNSNISVVSNEKPTLLHADDGKGLQIDGAFTKTNGQYVFELTATNHTQQPLKSMAIRFDKNSYSLTAESTSVKGFDLAPKSSKDFSIACVSNPQNSSTDSSGFIKIAVKTPLGTSVFPVEVEPDTMENPLFFDPAPLPPVLSPFDIPPTNNNGPPPTMISGTTPPLFGGSTTTTSPFSNSPFGAPPTSTGNTNPPPLFGASTTNTSTSPFGNSPFGPPQPSSTSTQPNNSPFF